MMLLMIAGPRYPPDPVPSAASRIINPVFYPPTTRMARRYQNLVEERTNSIYGWISAMAESYRKKTRVTIGEAECRQTSSLSLYLHNHASDKDLCKDKVNQNQEFYRSLRTESLSGALKRPLLCQRDLYCRRPVFRRYILSDVHGPKGIPYNWDQKI